MVFCLVVWRGSDAARWPRCGARPGSRPVLSLGWLALVFLFGSSFLLDSYCTDRLRHLDQARRGGALIEEANALFPDPVLSQLAGEIVAAAISKVLAMPDLEPETFTLEAMCGIT